MYICMQIEKNRLKRAVKTSIGIDEWTWKSQEEEKASSVIRAESTIAQELWSIFKEL